MVVWFCRYAVQYGTLICMINTISTDLDTEFNCCMVVWLNGFHLYDVQYGTRIFMINMIGTDLNTEFKSGVNHGHHENPCALFNHSPLHQLQGLIPLAVYYTVQKIMTF